MMERLVCSDCGMCYDADQERQHRDWHVDRHIQRLQRRDLSAMSDADLFAGIHAALDRLQENVAAVRHA